MFRNLFYHRVGLFSLFIKWMCRPCDTFVIGRKTKIGKGLLCVHPFATVINAKSVGDCFTIKNCVTIGINRRDEKPIIGNNVTVNSNSVVIGNITIGDNVIIGVGSVVNKDVPANSVVVGNPARIIRKNGIDVDVKL